MEAGVRPNWGRRVNRWRMATRLLAPALACVALATALTACGDGDERPEVEDLSPDAVAAVGGEEITRAEVRRRVDELQRGRRSADEATDREQLEQQATAALIQRSALEQEAKERGIVVTRHEILQRWRGVAAEQFRNRRQLRRFLGGQPLERLLEQLRMQTLQARIHDQVRAEADGDPERAVRRWQREFQKRWSERTACRDDYAVAGCQAEPG